MSNPVQQFLVGQRIWWRTPSIDMSKESNFFMRATIIMCRCRFPETPLAEIVYTIRTDSEVWSETEWRTRGKDIYIDRPVGGKPWTRARALKKTAKKKAKKKARRK